MSFFESKNNLIDFTARLSKLREELDFTHEALQENKEVERRFCLYDGLVGKGLNFTPMEMMLWVDRSFVWSYSVINSRSCSNWAHSRANITRQRYGLRGLGLI